MNRTCLSVLLTLILCSVAGADTRRGAVIFFGDSLTAGAGVDPTEAYPALIQKKIKDAGWDFPVVNAGLSGDTTAAAAKRLNWTLKRSAEVVVIALGGNDGLRGVPPSTTRKNLAGMIDAVRSSQPSADIVLAGMQMPPNYGQEYTRRFAEIYPELAREKKVTLIPFILDVVGGDEKLNLPDRIHPTAEGHKIVAETVWKTLEPVLRKRVRKS